MSDKLIDVEDLTQAQERPHKVNIKLTDEDRAILQAAADQRGVTLEEYLRWRLCTAFDTIAARLRVSRPT